MSRRTYQLLALALTLAGTSACDEAPEAAFGAGDVALRPGGYGSGGVLMNTSANGDWAVAHLDSQFGTDLDGVVLKSVVVKGKEKFDTVELERVWVEKGELVGSWKWLEFRGAEFVDSQWNLNIPGSQNAPERVMTIASYQVDAEGHHRYVFEYPNDPTYGLHFFNFFLFKMTPEEIAKLQDQGSKDGEVNPDEQQPQNLAVCAPDPENNGSIEALVYGDVYVDMTTGVVKERPFTLQIACLSGGTGKAGLWNFLPYTVGLEGFEGGIRSVRADYCGDGGTYTKPGNKLYLRDVFGLHDFGNAANNTTEMVAGRKGALCLDTPRDPGFTYADVDCGNGPPPACKDLQLGDFGPEALLQSKLP